RADRSPTDFYQLDIEMSFVTQEDVFATTQPVLQGVFEEFANGKTVDTDWPLISYRDSALWYGTDKPDLRNPIRMQVVSEHFAGSGFAIFAKLLEQDGTEIRAIPAPTGGSRKFCDRMNAFAQKEGLPGMGYIFWREKTLTQEDVDTLSEDFKRWEESFLNEKANEALGGKSGVAYIRYSPQDVEFHAEVGSSWLEGAGPLAKNIGPARTEAIRQQLGLGVGDAAFFLGGKPKSFERVAGLARNV
ncbi:TPA: amino acid--tRNA ligase-related protein, partial [Vibrio cholerae O1]